MTTDYSSALRAASDAAGSQHYPTGTLYAVATPIGNLADITLRALHVLALCDTIACEDTRHTQQMLRAYGIDKSSHQLLAVHQHNESEAAQDVVSILQQQKRVAYVSDAGTPGISDPGARLAAAVHAAGLRVMPLPGASSVTTLLSAAAIGATGDETSGFVFHGFLPAKAGERTSAVETLAAEPRAVVLLEAPHRILALAQSLSVLGERQVTVGRELTKQFEAIAQMPAAEFAPWLQADSNRQRGEFVMVLHPAPVAAQGGGNTKLLKLLMAELPLKTAVKLAAEITGEHRNALYEEALALKNASADDE